MGTHEGISVNAAIFANVATESVADRGKLAIKLYGKRVIAVKRTSKRFFRRKKSSTEKVASFLTTWYTWLLGSKVWRRQDISAVIAKTVRFSAGYHAFIFSNYESDIGTGQSRHPGYSITPIVYRRADPNSYSADFSSDYR